VLVPGFGAFDALGLEYYAGVTSLFRRWVTANRALQVLHYFDNFPTAAVVTRAKRLRSYLAKLIARGEILATDEVTLVGHSTAGLDIRRLLWDLWHSEREIAVDGGLKVPLKQIIGCVRRVVFLSAPHWGTNIADWVQAHSVLRNKAVEEFSADVARSQELILDEITNLISGGAR
jgi:triacylglycerol esterase/lipase EstA (alpha/beta hydrolase family)